MKRFTMKALLTAAVLALGLTIALPATTQNTYAAPKNITAANSQSKATTIKLGKTYRVKATKKTGDKMYTWVKFVAPKAGKYAFTFSNFTNRDKSQNDIGNSNSYLISKVKSKYSNTVYNENLTFSTKGGKTSTIWLCTKYSYNSHKPAKISSSTFLPSRTCTVSLKKGQVVYYKNHFAGSYKDPTYYYNVVVKKK